MRKTLISILCLVACAFHSMTYATDFASKVNTLIGTDYTGNTYPGAQVPFGMVQLSPDNGLPGWDRIAGYFIPTALLQASATPTCWERAPAICMIFRFCL